MFRTHGQRSAIGVEIAPGAIRLVQLAGTSGTPSVHATASLAGAKGVFSEGALDEAASRRIKDALKQGRFSGNQCTLVLPASAVYTECVEVPSLATDELRESVAWTAVDRLGVEKDDLVSGHVGVRNGTLGGSNQEVLVIAARKAVVTRALSLLAHAGLQTRRVELGSVAAMRLCWQASRDTGRGHSLGFLYLEDDRASLALLTAQGLSYFRSFEWESSKDIDPSLIPVAGDEPESKAWQWRQLGEHVLHCLRHAERRIPGSWPETIRISGPLAEEPGMAAAVGSVCGSTTELFDCTKRVDWSSVGSKAGSPAAWTAAVSTLIESPSPAPSEKPRRAA